MSVVGQNIRLTCQALEGTIIKEVHTGYQTKILSPSNYEISLGDIYSEETRETIFTVELPESAERKPVTIMKFKIEYFDITKSTFGSAECTCEINRSLSVENPTVLNFSWNFI
jgi:hypothetical protein